MNKLLFDKLGVLISTTGTVYNVDTLKEFIDYVSKIGYNTLYLEITAGYEIEDEPFFAYMRGKYNKAELKEIDEYAKSKGITVIPTIQTLAHLGFMFRWPKFFDYRDIDEIMMVGDPRVYELVEKMIKLMAECFSAKIVHLGMDEAFNLGRGKYYDVNGPRNRIDIMKEHVEKVLGICKKYDVTPEMWGDMYIRMAYGAYDRGEMTFDNSEDVAKSIDPNLKLHYWDYYSLTKDRYINFIDKFKKITNNIVFDGGVWNYIGFVPDNSYSIKATRAAFEACSDKGIKEVTITTWGGDSVQETSLWSTMPTLVAAAEFARGNYDMDDIKKKFKDLMDMDFDAFIALENVNKVKPRDQSNKERYLLTPSKYLLYNDVFAGFYDSTVDQSERCVFTDAAKTTSQYTEHPKWGYVFKVVNALAELMEIKFDLGVKTREAYHNCDKESLKKLATETYPLVIKRVENLYKVFRTQYYKENKPNGFEVEDIRFGGLIKRLENCSQILMDFYNGKLDRVEELDQKVVDYLDGTDTHVKGAFMENGYCDESSVLRV